MILESGVLSSPSPTTVLLPATGAGLVALFPLGLTRAGREGEGWDFKGSQKGVKAPLGVFRCRTAINFRLRGFSLSYLLSPEGAQPVLPCVPRPVVSLGWAAEEEFLFRAPWAGRTDRGC